jgi:hypothetical protein
MNIADIGWKEVSDLLSGMAGSLIALIFLRPPAIQMIGYIAGGVLASYYVAPAFVAMLGAPVPTTGFIVGLFSMSVIAKLFELVKHISISDITSIFRRK